MNYGLPYMGSKNSIAQKIVNFLPKAEHFYDLFGGGGAISHCALLSGKYKYVHYNELNPLVYKGFQMAINGEFKDEKRWISREDFNALKDTDPYVAICFSFGNNLKAYLYGKEIEPIKKAFHYAVCFDDYSLLDTYFNENKIRLHQSKFNDRRLEFPIKLSNLYRNNLLDLKKISKGVNIRKTDICACTQNLDFIARLQNLESLGRLQNLELTNLSYNDVKIERERERCIYCDIPYKNTAKYQDNFDYEKFYNWCLQQDNIYISEYQMPEDFKCILEIKRQNIFGQKQDNYVIEKLFTPKSNPRYRELKHFEVEDW